MKFLRGILDRFGVMGELMQFLWRRRLQWLIPLVIVLLLYSILMVMAQSAVIAPFIYTLF